MSAVVSALTGLLGWLGLAALAAVLLCRRKRREKRAHGREILCREFGITTDFRYSAGPHAGRWRSEVVADEFDNRTPAGG